MKKTYLLVRILTILLFSSHLLRAQNPDWETPFERSAGLETATYQECIAYYTKLAEQSLEIELITKGLTDSGKPLHLVVFSTDGNFDPDRARKDNRRIFFINNGIHPGEPCGVDANMMFFRELAFNKEFKELAGNVMIAAIPIYNIGGALNRGPYSRVNQVGPKEHGFRGNARNYDLNRDFVKQDTRNARSFAEIFQQLQPDVFLDTHTSDGADYQHIMTLVEGQADKLGGSLGNYYRDSFLPLIYEGMKREGFPMVPYVQTVQRTPDAGIQGFYDSPRYSSGYAALFHTMAMISEAHMLKTFKERVEGTYALIKTLTLVINKNSDQIGEMKNKSKQETLDQTEFPLHWTVNREKYSEVEFKGYEAIYKPSEITGADRLFYDRSKPWTKTIRHYNFFEPATVTTKAEAYIIPQAWYRVVDNLKRNGIKVMQLDHDSTMMVTGYRIAGYETRTRPYEGHYMHYDVEVNSLEQARAFRKGDYLVSTDQPGARYIIETLEPQGYDSFLVWNYFDTILQMKEYFDPYVFEDIAAEFLASHPAIKDQLESKKKEDEAFANNPRAQLFFVYQNMPNFEPEFMLYPVYKWMGN